MKNRVRIFLICLLSCLALFCAGCSIFGANDTQTNSGSGGNGGTAAERVEFNYNEEQGVFIFENPQNIKIVIVIDGVEYQVNSSEFNVANRITVAGVYSVKLLIYYTDYTDEQYFNYHLEQNGNEKKVEIRFIDEFGYEIKSIYLPIGEIVSANYFPRLPSLVGANYSWDTEYGFTANDYTEIRIIAEYTEYTITYQLNGGAFDGEYITVYTVANAKSLVEPKKDGYLFAGWYLNANFTGKVVTQVGGRGDSGNKTLYAKWSELTSAGKNLLTALENTLSQKTVTVTMGDYESAIDTSSGYYAHELNKGKPVSVITGGYCYEYGTKIYYKYSAQNNPENVLPLVGIYGNIAQITSESNSSFLVTLKDGVTQVRIKISNNLVISLTNVNGGEVIEIKYTVSKVTPKQSNFTLKSRLFVTFYYDGTFYAERDDFVESNVSLVDIPFIQELLQFGNLAYAEFALDEDGKNLVTNTSQVQDRVYAFLYTEDYLCNNTPVTIKFTCECKKCGAEGVVRTYTLAKSFSETLVNEYGEIDYSGLDEHLAMLFAGYHEVGDGYLIENVLIQGNNDFAGGKEEEYFKGEHFNWEMISDVVRTALSKGEDFKNLTIEVFTKRQTAQTQRITLHANGQTYYEYVLAYAGGYFNDYFVMQYLPSGKVYTGWYLDSEYQVIAESMQPNGVNSEFWAKIEDDNRKTITLHYGEGVKGLIKMSYYEMQGQEEIGYIKNMAQTQEVKFFNNANLAKLFRDYSVITENLPSGYSLAGIYLDKNYTIPLLDSTTVEEVTDLYFKWGKDLSYTLQFFNGDSLTFNGIEGALLESQIDSSYIDSVYDHAYYSVPEFYSDSARTKRIYSVISGNIYVGYKEYPTVTIACPEECNSETHVIKLDRRYFSLSELYYSYGEHGFYLDQIDYFIRYEFYVDKDCTIKAVEKYGKETFLLDGDTTFYAKPETPLREITVHCGCLNHGESGFKFTGYVDMQLNGLMENECDYGRYHNYFDFSCDAQGKEPFDFYNEDQKSVSEIWIKGFTPVVIVKNGEESTIFARDIRDVIYFYEQPIESDPNVTPETSYSPYGPFWCLFTDDSYSTPRIISSEYKLTAGEKFYFKQITNQEEIYNVTIKAENCEDYLIQYSFGELINCTINVYSLAFESYGKMAVGYYFDQNLTHLAMQNDQNYFLNQSVTLWAKLVDLPVLNVHAQEIWGESVKEYKLVYSCNYAQIISDFISNKEFCEGYVYELCYDKEGTKPVNLLDKAVAGDLYFLKNDYTKNNYKITVECEGENTATLYYSVGFYNPIPVGKDNYFYIPKGATGQDVYNSLHRYNAKFNLENGQTISVNGLLTYVDKMYNGEPIHWIEPFSCLKIYLDSAKTQPLTHDYVVTDNTTIYIEFLVEELNEHVVHFENGNTFTFYTINQSVVNGMPSIEAEDFAREILYALYGEASWECKKKHPQLFEYGYFTAYLDEEKTVQASYEILYNTPSDFYLTAKNKAK